MGKPILKVLVVDDYAPFRRVVRLILELRDDIQIVGEASDGLEAVQKAKRLTPDLILLDLDLPTLTGIQVARRLRDLVPRAKILFVSVESSPDVVREALSAGGAGYISKLLVGSELLPAIEVALTGKQFLGSGLEVVSQTRTQQHEMLVYSDDAVLQQSVTDFFSAAIKAGRASIVIATKAHRDAFLGKLKAQNSDVIAAIQNGTCVSLDAAETLSKFLMDGLPDKRRFDDVIGNVVTRVKQAAAATQAPVAVFGEMVTLLWAEGNKDGVLRLEQLWNIAASVHDLDILCGYPKGSFQSGKDESFFTSICSEHSAVTSIA